MANPTINVQVNANTAGAIANLSKLADALRTGFGIEAARRITDFFVRIPSHIQSFVQKGIQFNSAVEDAQLGIAAVLKQFDSGKYKTFQDAMVDSGKAIDALKQKALESPASFESLVEAFQSVAGPMAGARIELEKQVDLIVTMSQALSGLGITENQIVQETRALITGNINANAAAAKILEITPEDIRRAREAGQLYEFLVGKLAAFSEAGRVGARNWSTQLSNLGDVITQMAAKLARPLFEEFKRDLESINDYLASNSFQTSLERFIDSGKIEGTLLTIKQAVLGIVSAVILLGGVFNTAGTWIGTSLGFWFTTLQDGIRAMIQWFRIYNDSARAVIQTVVDLGRRVGDLGKVMLAASTGNFASAWSTAKELFSETGEEVKNLGGRLSGNIQEALAIGGRSAQSIWTNVKTMGKDAAEEITTDWQERWNKVLDLFDTRPKKAAESTAGDPDTAFRSGGSGVTDEGLKLLAELNEEYRKTILSRRELLETEYEDRLDVLRRQLDDEGMFYSMRLQLDAVYAERRRQLDQEEIFERNARSQTAYQQAIQTTNALLESGQITRRTAQERNNQAAREYIAHLRAQVEELEKIASLAPDAEELRAKIASIQAEIVATAATIRETGFVGTLKRNIQDLIIVWSDFGTNAANVLTDGLQTAVRGVTDSIMDAIYQTGELGRIWQSVGREILRNIIDIGVQWVTTHVLMKGVAVAWDAFTSALGWKKVAETNAQEAAKTPALSSNALLASIGSFGAAAAVGVAALVAAMAFGAFREGGYTGAGGVDDVAGIVHRGEYVMPANKSWIFPLLEAVRSGAIGAADLYPGVVGGLTRPVTSSAGAAASLPGLSGRSAASAPNVHVNSAPAQVVVLNSVEELRRYLESTDGRKQIVDAFSGRTLDLGLQT